MNALNPAQIRSLVVRTPNWLGDSVMALPALRALRAALPTARITVVGCWVDLLLDQGVADQLLKYPTSFPDRLRLSLKVRTLGAEHALVLPNSFESALAARSWGARWRVGYATDGRARLLTHPVPRPSPRQHQVDEYLTLLGAYGITPTETTPRLRLSPADSDGGVEALLREAGITPDATLVGLHLGAAFGPSKLWASERWVELVREMQGMRGIPVLLGSPGELPFAQEVRRRVGAPVPSLVGRDSSALLPRLLSRFDLLISGDTGVAHLAAAVGVGVVTLFGPTDPRLTAPRSAQARTIAKAVPCAPCFLTHCPIDHPCMAGIEVSDILEQLESLLWG